MRSLSLCRLPLALAFLGVVAPEPRAAEPKLRVWRKGGPHEKSVDVLFVGDGYTSRQYGKFWRDVGRYAKRLLKEPPFLWYRKRFNIRAAFVPSKHKGCDLSPKVEKVDTILQSHFDAPDGRLLTFKNGQTLREIATKSGPVDVIFVMVNTEKYGGAGTVLRELKVRGRPCPAPTFSAQDTRSFLIAVHELGHSFADLADTYVDDQVARSYPLPEGEKDLRESNVTLPGRFDPSSRDTLRRTIKWGHFLDLPGAKKRKWLHEGGHYRERGVFRPWKDCMMRSMGDPFCPVCCEEIAKAIVKACGEKWDDAAFHKKHPLRLWK